MLNDKTYVWEELSADGFDTNNHAQNTRYLITSVKESDANTVLKLPCDVTLGLVWGMGTSDPSALSWQMDSGVNRYILPANSDGNVNIDLNGHTLTFGFDLTFGGYRNTDGSYESDKFTFSNGTIELLSNSSTEFGGFTVGKNSSLTLSNCEIVSDFKGDEYNQFNVLDYGRLTLSNCTLTATNGDTTSVFLAGDGSETNIFNSTLTSTSYGITSNASGNESWNIKLKVSDSTITTTGGPTVLVNVPGKYTLEHSSFIGNGEGVVIRGGKATIDTCKINITDDNTKWSTAIAYDPEGQNKPISGAEFSQIKGFADIKNITVPEDKLPFIFTNSDGTWSSGNGVQFGALIVGDWASGYDYDASCELINTEIHMDDNWTDLPIVYLSQDNGNTTSLIYDDACKFFKKETEWTAEKAVVVNSKKEGLPAGLSLGTILVNGVAK